MSEIKQCVNCERHEKHDAYGDGTPILESDECGGHICMTPHPVTGRIDGTRCDTMRMEGHACGLDAILFKEDLGQKDGTTD